MIIKLHSTFVFYRNYCLDLQKIKNKTEICFLKQEKNLKKNGGHILQNKIKLNLKMRRKK